MSAITRIRLLGSFSAISIIWSAHTFARSRSARAVAMRTPTRRKFSISAKRNMIGIAHSSPSFSAVTVW